MKNSLMISLFSFCLMQTAAATTPAAASPTNGYFANEFLRANPEYCPEVFTTSLKSDIDDTATCKSYWDILNAYPTPEPMRAMMVMDSLGGQKRNAKLAYTLAIEDGVTDDMYPSLLDDIKQEIKHPTNSQFTYSDYRASAETLAGPEIQAEADIKKSYTANLLDKFVSEKKPNAVTFDSLTNLYKLFNTYAEAHIAEAYSSGGGDANSSENSDNADFEETSNRFHHLFLSFTHDPIKFIQKNINAKNYNSLLSIAYAKDLNYQKTKECQSDDACPKLLDPQQPWLDYRNSFVQFAQSYCAQLNTDAKSGNNLHAKTCGTYDQQQVGQSISNYLIKERYNDIIDVFDAMNGNTV